MNENEMMEAEPISEELDAAVTEALEDTAPQTDEYGTEPEAESGDVGKESEAADGDVNAESFGEMDELEKYYTLRRLGFSHDDACLVSGGALDALRGKGHLRSAVAATAKSPTASMPAKELAEARELFRDLTDAQIQNLYKTVTK